MKPVAFAMLLLLMPFSPRAQQSSLDSCLDGLKSDLRLAALAGKVELGATGDPAPSMFSNPALPSEKERKVIPLWAEARAACVRDESRYGNATYRPPLQKFALDREDLTLSAIHQLYEGGLSYGEFNRMRQAARDDSSRKVAELRQKTEVQRTALEQADRQAREHAQLRQAIEDTQREARAANQQAEAAKQRASSDAADRYVVGGSRFAGPRRDCYRFGNRIVCTGR